MTPLGRWPPQKCPDFRAEIVGGPDFSKIGATFLEIREFRDTAKRLSNPTVPTMTMNGTVHTWRLRVAHLLALGVLYPYPEPLEQVADRGTISICYEISIPHVCALTSPYFHQKEEEMTPRRRARRRTERRAFDEADGLRPALSRTRRIPSRNLPRRYHYMHPGRPGGIIPAWRERAAQGAGGSREPPSRSWATSAF